MGGKQRLQENRHSKLTWESTQIIFTWYENEAKGKEQKKAKADSRSCKLSSQKKDYMMPKDIPQHGEQQEQIHDEDI